MTFDMQEMELADGGFEIDLHQAGVGRDAADLATKYKVEQWRYAPTASYGGPKIDEETLTVTDATLSADGKKVVTLKVDGLKPDRVVYIRSPRPFAASDGSSCGAPRPGTRSTSCPATSRRSATGSTSSRTASSPAARSSTPSTPASPAPASWPASRPPGRRR